MDEEYKKVGEYKVKEVYNEKGQKIQDILAEILTFGNIVEVNKWAILHEVDAELPDEWTKPKIHFSEINGDQLDLQSGST